MKTFFNSGDSGGGRPVPVNWFYILACLLILVACGISLVINVKSPEKSPPETALKVLSGSEEIDGSTFRVLECAGRRLIFMQTNGAAQLIKLD